MINTVILLDYSQSVRRALSLVLRKQGYQVRTFTQPARFLKYFHSNSPDLCIIDCDLLDLGLLSTTNGSQSSIGPRLILTTALSQKQRELEQNYPALVVLLKPFGFDQLLNAIARTK